MGARVFQLNTSPGGVPKLPVDTFVVEPVTGVVGDVQAERKHHGRPWQALCLWAVEVIEALKGEGHPIAPGFAGENVTIAGLDWEAVRPGVQLRLGAGDDAVLCEITAAAVPCKKQRDWFADGDWNRIDDDRHPGWARMYAAVLGGGTLRAGDPVVVVRAEINPTPLRTSAELNARWGGW
jgi:MOSC domain-containing protein YiiM